MAPASIGTIWKMWIGSCTAGTTAGLTYYSTADTWQGWNSIVTSSATANQIWVDWNAITHLLATLPEHWQQSELTEEQRAEQQRQREAAEAKRHAEVMARERERERAQRRARAFLRRHLTTQQRSQLREHNYFELLTAEGRRYRIERGWAGNVKLLDEQGVAVRSFCIHTREDVPYEDNMLAQKLLLETDEARFVQTANPRELRLVG